MLPQPVTLPILELGEMLPQPVTFSSMITETWWRHVLVSSLEAQLLFSSHPFQTFKELLYSNEGKLSHKQNVLFERK
jgi:hypothetical protein